jgi:hypothetical protein
MPLPGVEERQVEVFDVVTRHLVLPTGTSVVIPHKHEWVIMAMTALPHPSYSPPGTPRDAYAFGDVRLRVDGRDFFHANALTLMDRYWGRYNLHPEIADVVAKLDEAQHALQTAPTIPDLAMWIEKAADAAKLYQNTVSPSFDKPGIVKSEETLTIEQAPCQGDTVQYTSIDVELLLVIKRPVVGRRAEATT